MSLEKLQIIPETAPPGTFDPRQAIKVLFNPNQLATTRSTTWAPIDPAKSATNAPVQFQKAEAGTLSVSLFFDTYAPYGATTSGGAFGLTSATATGRAASVKDLTDKVMDLAKINVELHRPPACQLVWGSMPRLFQGVLQRATCTYIMFAEDGTPVRATMDCAFMEYADPPTAANEPHSPDVDKRYVVRPRDTLMAIAATFYGDGSLWRRIADANAVPDPRVLTPGQVLSIPRIR